MTETSRPETLEDAVLDATAGGLTQNDLDNGRLIAEVGVALQKPAEFMVFRIGQKTADACP